MVIFHGYVSLPEGKQNQGAGQVKSENDLCLDALLEAILCDGKEGKKHIHHGAKQRNAHQPSHMVRGLLMNEHSVIDSNGN